MFAGNKGFTILEVVLGASIFLVGMLGVAGLQISAINAEAFSARMSEGTMLARSMFEELMTYTYTDDRLDDDDCSGWTNVATCDGDPAFNLDVDMGPTTGKNVDLLPAGAPPGNNIPDVFENADSGVADSLTGVGTNGIFNVAYSICEDCLIDDTKSVRVIVYWRLKSEFNSIDFYGVIPRK